MKLVEMDGLTGKVKFDQLGLRTDFTLEIVELKRQGLTKVFYPFFFFIGQFSYLD